MDLNEEIQESISQNPMGEPSMDELEEELQTILAGDEKTRTVAPPMKKTETPPKRTAVPSGVGRVPHQELVNSLCQMKVMDRTGQFALSHQQGWEGWGDRLHGYVDL